MRQLRPLLITLALFGLTLSGCGGDDLIANSDKDFPECTGDECGPRGQLDTPTVPTPRPGEDDPTPDPEPTDPEPTPPPGPTFLDLSGEHRTHYSIDLSSYLYGVSNLAGPLDTIDQALAGRIDTGIGFVNDLIADVIANYIPYWVVEVVSVLNNVANFLNDIQPRGMLTLTQSAGDELHQPLAATEEWSSLSVMIIENCPLGRNDPSYPSCAEVPIAFGTRNNVGPLAVGVDLKPFSGSVSPGETQADVIFRDREMEVEVNKLVTAVIDIAIRVRTNGQVQGLEDALDRAVDCVGFAADARGIIEGFLGASTAQSLEPVVATACGEVKALALQEIMNQIDGIGFGWDAMTFHQIGLAIDKDGNNRADTLQEMTAPDTISGEFSAIDSSVVEGSWQGDAMNP